MCLEKEIIYKKILKDVERVKRVWEYYLMSVNINLE